MTEERKSPEWAEGEIYEGVILDHRIEELNNEKRTPYLLIIIDSDGDYAFVKEWLTDKALPYSVRRIKRLGFTGEDIVLLNLPEEDEAVQNAETRSDFSLRGTMVKFRMERSEDGQYWNVKSYWNPASSAGKKKRPTASEDTLASISAKSKAAFASSGADEEIPF